MDHPSSLPNFKGLVKKIARGTPFEEKVENPQYPYDRLLGEMERGGIRIREIAKNILSDQNSIPTELHDIILNLFEKNKIRIVTTNFDQHFSTLSKKKNINVETYHAPALPLGDSFQGIVYLHGSIIKNQMVLTEEDFGKAYLTEGWARRFLVKMFSKYTILFIGYGYNDTVIHYLTKGLPSQYQEKAFILVSSNGNNNTWLNYGITPIKYPLKIKDNNKKDHRELIEGIKKWQEYHSKGLLDHERKIKDIVSKRPPVDKEEIDYIIDMISNEQCVKYFIKYTTDPLWIKWLSDKKLIDDIFNPKISLSNPQKRLADWLAKTFLYKHSDELIKIISKHHQRINPSFWHSITNNLKDFHRSTINRDTVDSLVNFLLNTIPIQNEFSFDYLLYILQICRMPKDKNIAIALFSYLINPRIKFKNEDIFLAGNKGELPIDIQMGHDTDNLNKHWEILFQKNLEDVGERFFYILKEYIEKIYDLYFDKNFYRHSIERNSDNFSNEANFLIDIFSDILNWASSLKSLTLIILEWINSEKELFKRFSVYAMEKTSCFTPLEKKDWILRYNLCTDISVDSELYCLLKDIYPKIEKREQHDLLNSILNSILNMKEDNKKLSFEITACLECLDPKCEVIGDKIKKFKKKYLDGHFPNTSSPKQQRNPQSINSNETPYSKDELLKIDLNKKLDKLIEWRNEYPSSFRRGLLFEIEQVTIEDFSWSLAFHNLLMEKSLWECDLWQGIIIGWSKSNLERNQWETIFSFLRKYMNQLKKFSYEFSTVLWEGIQNTKNPIPFTSFEDSMDLSDQLWNIEKEVNQSDGDIDWHIDSLNSRGGRITEFWHHLLSRIIKEEGKDKLLKKILSKLKSVLDGNSYQDKLGQVVISYQTSFLFSVDDEWVIENIIPYFDIDNNEQSSDIFWESFLYWGRWSDELLNYLKPFFKKVFKKQDFIKKTRPLLAFYVAEICLYTESDFINDDWLNSFIKNSSQEVRKSFSDSLQKKFNKMNSNLKTRAWKKWIKDYLSERELGRPFLFTHGEKESMFLLILNLPEKKDYTDAIDVLCHPSSLKLNISYLLHVVKDNKTDAHKKMSTCPNTSLKLILYLLEERNHDEAQGINSYFCQHLEPIVEKIINNIKDNGNNHDLRRKLIEMLAAMDCKINF